jgi:hypothetical protein
MILVVGSTYLIEPDIYSRIFLAKDPGTAKSSILMSSMILIPCHLPLLPWEYPPRFSSLASSLSKRYLF